MKNIRTLMLGLLMTASLTTTAAYAQTSTPSATPSPKSNSTIISPDKNKVVDVLNVLGDKKGDKNKDVTVSELLIVLLLTMIAGGCGGFVFELLNLQGNIEKPHKPSEDDLAAKFAYASPKNVVDLGVGARIIIGVFAAPPAILFLQPESIFALIAMSLLAGSAGTAVFRALQDRLVIAVAQKEKDEKDEQYRKLIEMLNQTLIDIDEKTPEEAKESLKNVKALCQSIVTVEKSKKAVEPTKLQDKVDEAIDAFQNLKSKLIKATTREAGENKLTVKSGMLRLFLGASLEQEDLDKIGNLLSEIKGLCPKNATPNDSINQNIDQVDQAIKAFETLKANIIKKSIRPGGKSTLEFTDGASLEQKDLDDLEKLLSQLKGSLSKEETNSLAA